MDIDERKTAAEPRFVVSRESNVLNPRVVFKLLFYSLLVSFGAQATHKKRGKLDVLVFFRCLGTFHFQI